MDNTLLVTIGEGMVQVDEGDKEVQTENCRIS